MNNKEIAQRIIKRNLQKVKDELFTNGIMFDDDFDESMSRPVAREMPPVIEEEFGSDIEERSVLRTESKVNCEYRGAFWLSDFTGAPNINEYIKKHYE